MDEQHSRKLRFEAIDHIRSIYRSASKAFLLNHPLQVWLAIQSGLTSIHQSLPTTLTEIRDQKPWWFQNQSSVDSTINHEFKELEKKFQILKITFFTSILPSTQSIIHQINHTPSPNPAQIEPFLSILSWIQIQDPFHFILCLLVSIQSGQPELTPYPKTKDPQTCLIQLSSDLYHLHPCILTALGLATIKLNIPQIGKQLIEGWLASTDCFDLHTAEPCSYAEGDDYPLTNDLRTSYHKLIQVYSIHILGSLQEWDFAIDFVNAQSQLSGGILQPETVQNLIEGIELNKSQQMRLIQQVIHRQQQQQKHRATRKESLMGGLKEKTKKRRHSKRVLLSGEEEEEDEQDEEEEQVENEEVSEKRPSSNRRISTSEESHESPQKTGIIYNKNGNGSVSPRRVSGFASLRNQLSKFISTDPTSSSSIHSHSHQLDSPRPNITTTSNRSNNNNNGIFRSLLNPTPISNLILRCPVPIKLVLSCLLIYSYFFSYRNSQSNSKILKSVRFWLLLLVHKIKKFI